MSRIAENQPEFRFLEATAGQLHPDFSVIVWVSINEHFGAMRSELISIAGRKPYQMFEYEGVVDFHWGFDNVADALRLTADLEPIAERPEVVVLPILSRINEIDSISLKDDHPVKD